MEMKRIGLGRRVARCAALLLAFLFTPALAQVSVPIACAGGAFGDDCSLAELDGGGKAVGFDFYGTRFDNFQWSSTPIFGSLGSIDDIKVEPIVSTTNPGLRFRDFGTGWEAVGQGSLPTVVLNMLSFDILRLEGATDPILGRRMVAELGEIFEFTQGVPDEDSNVFIKDRMILNNGNPPQFLLTNEAVLQCFASEMPECQLTRRRDSHAGAQTPEPFIRFHDMTASIEFNIGAEPTGKAEVEEFIYQLRVPETKAFTDLPDGNGTTDFGVMLRDWAANRNWLYVMNGGSGSLMRQIGYGTERPLALITAPDFTMDLFPEPAVFVDGSISARVKDSTNGVLLGRPRFDDSYEPFAYLSVGDANADSVPDFAIIGREITTGRVRAQVKAAVDNLPSTAAGDLVGFIFFDKNFDPFDAVVLDNIGESPAKEIAVLGIDAAGRVRAQIKDAQTGAKIELVYFDKNFTPLAFAALPDANGDLTLLGVLGRNQAGLIRAQVKRAADGAKEGVAVRFDSAYEPRAFLGFTDNNASGAAELAVVGVDAAGVVRAQVKDLSDASPVRVIPFNKDFPPIDALAVNGVAGTGRDEIAVLGENAAGEVQVQVKDLLTGDPVKVIPVP